MNGVGTGGAATKASAAKLASAAGVGVLVTSADLVAQALAGDSVGTWFAPHPDPVTLSTGPVGAVRAAID